jgi:hypothetical protein
LCIGCADRFANGSGIRSIRARHFGCPDGPVVLAHRELDGTVKRLTLHQNGDRQAQRIEPFVPPVEALTAFAGTYYSDELDTTYRLVVEDSRLTARDRRNKPVSLDPTAQDTFAVPGAEVRFRRNASGTVDGFAYSSGRVMSVLFERKAQ